MDALTRVGVALFIVGCAGLVGLIGPWKIVGGLCLAASWVVMGREELWVQPKARLRAWFTQPEQKNEDDDDFMATL